MGGCRSSERHNLHGKIPYENLLESEFDRFDWAVHETIE